VAKESIWISSAGKISENEPVSHPSKNRQRIKRFYPVRAVGRYLNHQPAFGFGAAAPGSIIARCPTEIHRTSSGCIAAVCPQQGGLRAAKLDHIREILNRSELQKSYQFPDGIEFGVLNTNDAVDDPEEFAIYFFPRGDSTGAKIVLHNLRRQNYTITVDMITGSVEIDR